MIRLMDLTAAQTAAAIIAEHAAKPENWYRPGQSPIPGDLPSHVLLLPGGIRAVFSWTVAPKDVRRHLSISVVGAPQAFPAPVIAWTLAKCFGFTGAKVESSGVVLQPARSWVFLADREEHCVVVQEVVPDTNPPN